MWGRKFLHGVEILGGFLIFVFIANLSALARESVIYSLGPNNSGIQPNASLISDRAGNLYGTTSNQGFWRYGAVFELTPHSDGAWTETTLYAFTGGSDGATPMANLIFDQPGNLYSGLTLDAAGNLYGTTSQGGSYGCGTVFRLTKSATGRTESLLQIFAGGSDGNFPVAGAIFDRAGNLYGTTEFGGIQNQDGYGTVFKLSPSVGNVERSRSPSLPQRQRRRGTGRPTHIRLAWTSVEHNLRRRKVCIGRRLRSDSIERELDGKSAV